MAMCGSTGILRINFYVLEKIHSVASDLGEVRKEEQKTLSWPPIGLVWVRTDKVNKDKRDKGGTRVEKLGIGP